MLTEAHTDTPPILANMTVTTNPAVVAVQSRLHAPNYAGPGKWILLEPASRRSFLAAGPDVIPDVFRVLSVAARPVPVAELCRRVSSATPEAIEHLLEARLLITDSNVLQPENFISRYHAAVLDYPAFDYFNPDWGQKDIELMKAYEHLWPPPPRATPRSGVSHALPAVSTDFLVHAEEMYPNELEILATVLRYTFGPIGEVPWALGNMFRKTSPSGGARHPSEGVILLPRNWGHIPRGAYVYDIEQHTLVAEGGYEGILARLGGDAIAFVVRARVERSMWRYRDIWAFRAVLLDVGHILETLSLLLGRFGFASAWSIPPRGVLLNVTQLEEPELAMLVAKRRGIGPVDIDAAPAEYVLERDEDSRHLTNPAMYLSFIPNGMRACILWPTCRELEISLDDFLVLNHCLPSKRGDRATTVEGIVGSLPDTSEVHVRRLIEATALLPHTLGRRFYRAADLWIQYGWYDTLLAHLDAVASRPTVPVRRYQVINSLISVGSEIGRVMLARRTCRAFRNDLISLEQLVTVCREAMSAHFADITQTVRIFVAMRSVAGLEPGLYEWHGEHFVPASGDMGIIDQHIIRSSTIGQAPAAAGAATIWVVRAIKLTSGAEYEEDIISLGQIGQRICLAATAQCLGVFLTPSVYESTIFQALGVADHMHNIVYVFGLGVPRG